MADSGEPRTGLLRGIREDLDAALLRDPAATSRGNIMLDPANTSSKTSWPST